MHVCVVMLQRASVTHGMPTVSHPVRPALQRSGCLPLQRVAPTAHTGAVHTPPAALHSAAVAQVVGVSV